MADTSSDNSAESEPAGPFEPEFDTDLHCHRAYSYAELCNNRNPNPCTVYWENVDFDMSLNSRCEGRNFELQKDLELRVICNRYAHDPFWRCKFKITVECRISGEAKSIEQALDADNTNKILTVVIMEYPEDHNALLAAKFDINIEVISWTGINPHQLRPFYDKTDISDATLIVEDKRLYVTRAILALHSRYFYRLFFDKRFTDWKKDEFHLPDISYTHMDLFLCLIYPSVTANEDTATSSIDTIEKMLHLAEFFECNAVTRLMEERLTAVLKTGAEDEEKRKIEGCTFHRGLLLSDKYRLSDMCGTLIFRLCDDAEMHCLGSSEKFPQLSHRLLDAVTLMRSKHRNVGIGAASLPASLAYVGAQTREHLLSDLNWSGAFSESFLAGLPKQHIDDWKQTASYIISPAPFELPDSILQLVKEVQMLAAINNKNKYCRASLKWATGTFISFVDKLEEDRAAAAVVIDPAAAAAVDRAAPVAPAATDAAESAAPAAAVLSLQQFRNDVSSLRAAVPDFAPAIVRPSVFASALEYLLHINEADFKEINEHLRTAIHDSIKHLIYLSDPRHEMNRYTKDVVDRFIPLVESLRKDGSSSHYPPLSLPLSPSESSEPTNKRPRLA